ncbi:MAG TPA: glycerophosphodiester phosphodiesterase family protein [Caulobacteraceae bacterium]|jgi:glycerophosphoryl diester phosphodiesterase|nr:glycerophosphodiester phosphodiesterase family protein [Caulobacteraceae bacterium]
MTQPLLIAGATGYGAWPSNSLEGTLRCLEAPDVDGVEIDVQITADGHVVAHHDYRLSPDQTRLNGAWIAEASAPLRDMTLADLRRYDIGRTRPDTEAAARYVGREEMDGVAIPTLPELLAALKAADGPPRLLYVEIKTDPRHPEHAPAPQPVVDAVFRDLEAADWVAHSKIIAFDWQVLRLSEARSPGVRTAHLTIPTPADRPRAARPSPWYDGFDAYLHGGSELAAIKAHGGMEWSPYYTAVTGERMAEARELGLRVGPWGLSKGDDIRRMRDLGVYSSTVSGADWGF